LVNAPAAEFPNSKKKQARKILHWSLDSLAWVGGRTRGRAARPMCVALRRRLVSRISRLAGGLLVFRDLTSSMMVSLMASLHNVWTRSLDLRLASSLSV